MEKFDTPDKVSSKEINELKKMNGMTNEQLAKYIGGEKLTSLRDNLKSEMDGYIQRKGTSYGEGKYSEGSIAVIGMFNDIINKLNNMISSPPAKEATIIERGNSPASFRDGGSIKGEKAPDNLYDISKLPQNLKTYFEGKDPKEVNRIIGEATKFLDGLSLSKPLHDITNGERISLQIALSLKKDASGKPFYTGKIFNENDLSRLSIGGLDNKVGQTQMTPEKYDVFKWISGVTDSYLNYDMFMRRINQ